MNPPVAVVETLVRLFPEACHIPVEFMGFTSTVTALDLKRRPGGFPLEMTTTRSRVSPIWWKWLSTRRRGGFHPIHSDGADAERVPDVEGIQYPPQSHHIIAGNDSIETVSTFDMSSWLANADPLLDNSWLASPYHFSDDGVEITDASLFGREPEDVYQLTQSGGLDILRISDSVPGVDSSCNIVAPALASTGESTLLVMDMDSLAHLVTTRPGVLLPLDLACLYAADPSVVAVVGDAHPNAMLREVDGMLPIHRVATGWTLSPLAPASLLPCDLVETNAHIQREARIPEILGYFRFCCPESVHWASTKHSLTPMQYVEMCQQNGPEKEQSRLALLEDPFSASTTKELPAPATKFSFCRDTEDLLDDFSDASSRSLSIIFMDSNENDSVNEMSKSVLPSIISMATLLANQCWAEALAAVEDDPAIATKWLYGIDDEDESTTLTVWKRLPLHLAIVKGAPLGLVEALVRAYPASLMEAEHITGSVPLHLLCQQGPALCPQVWQLVLKSAPSAAQVPDQQGRIPLHLATIHEVPLVQLQDLIHLDEASVAAIDETGKTPLDYAIELGGSDDNVTMLLKQVLYC
jgi:hypothetical protein